MRARRRQAQRPRERRLHRASPHLLRDAGQLQLRRLLQARRHQLRLGAADRVYKLPKDKLTVTVYAEDDEAYDIWTKEIGVPAERVIRIGDNKGALRLRQLLDDGRHRPLRPVHRDLLRPRRAHLGRPPGSPEEDGDRFIEIWNNVFMQFNRDEPA
jgi:alanyl-tRNA synthetase